MINRSPQRVAYTNGKWDCRGMSGSYGGQLVRGANPGRFTGHMASLSGFGIQSSCSIARKLSSLDFILELG